MESAEEISGQIGLPPDNSPTSSPEQFAIWIDAARQGCEQAFNQLLTACRPYLLLVANRELVPEIRAKLGASDIVQETLTHVRQQFDRFRGSSQPELIAWTRDMLLKNMFDAKRRYLWTEMRQVGRELSLERDLADGGRSISVGGPGPEHYLARTDEAQRLNAALDRLPVAYQQVIRLRHWEEKSFAEIGLCLNRTPDAARKLWARAVDQLRQQLGPGESP